MAKNIDEITLKVGVEGAASLDQLDSKLGNIDKSTKAASESLKQFNIRNIAYQVQDLAVQLSMGTNAFVAFGQQLPQLLSGFGVAGAVIGAVAAIAIPLLREGLKVLGVDMRNLSEITKDLSTEIQKNQEAQKLNSANISSLTFTYGNLSEAAKQYFSVVEQTSKMKVGVDADKNLKELLSTYASVYDSVKRNIDVVNKLREAQGLPPTKLQFSPDMTSTLMAKFRGLSEAQALELGKRLRELDQTNPENLSKGLSSISEWLAQSSKEAGNFERVYEKVIVPIDEVNKLILEQVKNIRAAADAASVLQTDLTTLQNKFLPDINAAKRNFNQIEAINKESQLKIAEFNRQLKQKEDEGILSADKLAAERSAGLVRIEQERLDKIKDFVKSQNEAYRSSVLQNDTKRDQLSLQSQILALTEEGRLSSFNVLQLEQDLLTNANNYHEALRAIGEQRRKNVIDSAQQSKLEKEAAGILDKANQVAYEAADRRQKSFLETQKQIIEQDGRRLELFNRTATMSDRVKKNEEAIFNINEERVKQLKGLESLNDPILRIVKEKEVNATYDERIAKVKEQQDAEKALQENFGAGFKQAFANYVEDSQNAFKQAQTAFQTLTKSMEDMFVNFFKTGRLGWKDFLATMAEELLRSQIRQLIAKTFSIAGAGGGGSGGLFGGSIIPGFLASGGPASANTPYIVGEKGPELFVPNSTGTIVPNNKLGSAANVTYNINAVDAMSFKQMIAQDPSFIYAVSLQGARTVPGVR